MSDVHPLCKGTARVMRGAPGTPLAVNFSCQLRDGRDVLRIAESDWSCEFARMYVFIHRAENIACDIHKDRLLFLILTRTDANHNTTSPLTINTWHMP